MILKPHVHQLLSPFQHTVIHELLGRQDAERLVNFMTHYKGTRYVLTGYDSFGGTTLTEELSERVRQRLDPAEVLVPVRFDRVPNLNNLPIFKVFLQATRERVPIAKCTLEFEDTTQRDLSTVKEVLNSLDSLISERSHKSNIYKKLRSKLKQGTAPLRVIVIVDNIVSSQTLATFLRHRLFIENQAALLVVVERETYNRWDRKTKRFFRNKRGLKEWYVPCLWEPEYEFVAETLDLLFSGYSVSTPEAHEMRQLLSQHIAFIGRGIVGRTLRELQDYHKYWQLDDNTGQPFITLETLDLHWLSNNARLQEILDQNWDKILDRNFPRREVQDRAKQGVFTPYLIGS
jgi:hypothetical protein